MEDKSMVISPKIAIIQPNAKLIPISTALDPLFEFRMSRNNNMDLIRWADCVIVDFRERPFFATKLNIPKLAVVNELSESTRRFIRSYSLDSVQTLSQVSAAVFRLTSCQTHFVNLNNQDKSLPLQ